MTQDNNPIAPKEPAWKHSRWGIASLVIAILCMPVFLYTFVNNPSSFDLLGHIVYQIKIWLGLGFPVSLILALIGLVKDQKKNYSILSLFILGIVFCYLCLAFLSQ